MAFRNRKTRTLSLDQMPEGDRIGTLTNRVCAKRVWAYDRWAFWWRHPLLHALWMETCSFCLRIQRIYRRGREAHVHMGPDFLLVRGSNNLILNTTQQGRIQCIERLQALYPPCSLEDCQV